MLVMSKAMFYIRVWAFAVLCITHSAAIKKNYASLNVLFSPPYPGHLGVSSYTDTHPSVLSGMLILEMLQMLGIFFQI